VNFFKELYRKYKISHILHNYEYLLHNCKIFGIELVTSVWYGHCICQSHSSVWHKPHSTCAMTSLSMLDASLPPTSTLALGLYSKARVVVGMSIRYWKTHIGQPQVQSLPANPQLPSFYDIACTFFFNPFYWTHLRPTVCPLRDQDDRGLYNDWRGNAVVPAYPLNDRNIVRQKEFQKGLHCLLLVMHNKIV